MPLRSAMTDEFRVQPLGGLPLQAAELIFQMSMIGKRARLGSAVRCITGWDNLDGRAFDLRKESIQH